MRVLPPLPAGFSREVQPGRIIVRQRHLTSSQAVLFAVALLTDLALWRGQHVLDDSVPLSPRGIMVAETLLAFAVNYAALAALFNSRRVEVTLERLRVGITPLPWQFPVQIEPGAIRDIMFREIAEPGYASTYDLLAIGDGGLETKLIGGLGKYEHAVFYVGELRSILGLPLGRPLQPLGG